MTKRTFNVQVRIDEELNDKLKQASKFHGSKAEIIRRGIVLALEEQKELNRISLKLKLRKKQATKGDFS